MIAVPLRIITDTDLTVTTTAARLYALMDSASSITNSQTYYDDAEEKRKC